MLTERRTTLPRLYDKTVRGIVVEVVEVNKDGKKYFELRMDNQTKSVSEDLDTVLNRFYRVV